MSFEETKPEKQPLLFWHFPYGLPKTQPLDYGAFFEWTDEKMYAKLAKLSETRAAMQTALEYYESTSAQEFIDVITIYLAHLYGLACSLENDPSIRLSKPIIWQWGSPTKRIGNKSVGLKTYIGMDYRYELIMTLTCLALSHYRKAGEITRDVDHEAFPAIAPTAAEHLRIAAGIFQYLGRVEYPRWIGQFPSKPLEAELPFIKCWAGITLATCQSVVIKKALCEKKTSNALLSKLSIDVFLTFEKAFEAIMASECGKKIKPGFVYFLWASVCFNKAIAMKATASAHYDKEELGHCIGFCRRAIAELDSIKPPEGAERDFFLKELRDARNDVRHIARTYKLQNDNIFIQKPVEDSLLKMPEGKRMVTPLEWKPLKPTFRSL